MKHIVIIRTEVIKKFKIFQFYSPNYIEGLHGLEKSVTRMLKQVIQNKF